MGVSMERPAAVLELAAKVFNSSPSITAHNDTYVVMTAGRLFIWNDEEKCLYLLLSMPMPDGQVELFTVPEAIIDRKSLSYAIQTANQMFHDMATWPAPASTWGHEAEELFIDICKRLGFAHATQTDPKAPYTIRLSTPREDSQDKIDFVLTASSENGANSPETIPIQLSISADRAKTRRKARAANLRERKVAYIAIRRFMYADKIEKYLRAAAAGKHAQLWFAAQIIKDCVTNYLGRGFFLPSEPLLTLDIVKTRLFRDYCKLVTPKIKRDLTALLARANEDNAEEIIRYLNDIQGTNSGPLLNPKLFAV